MLHQKPYLEGQRANPGVSGKVADKMMCDLHFSVMQRKRIAGHLYTVFAHYDSLLLFQMLM